MTSLNDSRTQAASDLSRKLDVQVPDAGRPGEHAGEALKRGSSPDAGDRDGQALGEPGPARVRATRISARVAPVPAPTVSRLGEDRSSAIAQRLIESVGADRFARWFGTADAISHEGRSVVVRVPDKAAGSLLEKRFGREIREAIQAEAGEGSSLELRVMETEGVERDVLASVGGAGVETAPAPSSGAIVRKPSRTVLGDRYRLESFLVGQSNRLAYNAAVQMAEGIGQSGGAGLGQKGCSPLFLHGPCGVGKTHLLQGVAVRFKERHPGTTVRVTSGEQFMNDFVNAIRHGSSSGSSGNSGGSGVERFRRAYRKVDLLCIDDVHFLASKQATQAELLHTFDEIERGGARIILVSDEHPRQLSKFSPALVSRFMSGMVAGMQTPDAELREKIVRGYAASRGMVLEDSATALLVERTAPMPGAGATSVREIEGLLVKVEALHRLTDSAGGAGTAKVSAATVARAIDGESSDRAGVIGPARPVRMEQIVAHTCSVLGVDTGDLGAKTRHKRVVLARAVITHLARQHTTLSYPEIARAIGRPNHSTVITAHQRLAKQIEADEPIDTLMGGPIPGEARSVAGLVRQLSQSVVVAARRG